MRSIKSILSLLAGSARRATTPVVAAVLGLAILPGVAQAAFVGAYELSNFSLINTNADGFWSSPDDETLILTGGNNGSGLTGSTQFLVTAPQTVQVSFDFLWTTDDSEPTFDTGGYFALGLFQPLTLLQTMGSRSLLVQQGQGFGFEVRTDDNFGGPGSLTITNFQAVPHTTAVTPEPSTAIPILLVVGGYLLRTYRRNARCESQRQV